MTEHTPNGYRFQAGQMVTLANGEEVNQPGHWLTLIREANGVHDGMFKAPVLDDWWAGGEVEEYPDARVIHLSDNPDPFYRTVWVVPKTELGEQVLAQAYAILNEKGIV